MKEISGLRIYITSTNSMQLIAKRFYWHIKKVMIFYIFMSRSFVQALNFRCVAHLCCIKKQQWKFQNSKISKCI